jgi:hypothetical protein
VSHIIGRPDDNLLDIMLGPAGADPEQALVGDRDQGAEDGDGDDDGQPGEEP